ncbi:MAG TPA: hypothetical protein PK668_20835 [Myxococcota bacterium]|nr:hypothetical protein [Myxococcota bacterium]HRY96642.1 hypothetical protein [Myxococcota bacterium]
MAMHLLGTGIDMMLTVFAVCAAVLVFGEQRYSLLAACGIALLFAIKVWLLDVSFDWRAFGFGAASFLSLVFWSPSFQEGFLGLTDHLVPGRPDQAR